MRSTSVGSPGEPVIPELLCSRPYMLHGYMPVRCGQCHCCRITRKAQTVLRGMLELMEHEHASCVTLTYSDEFVGDGNVRPADWIRCRDRLRFMFREERGQKLRFFGVGEYGEQKWRPHWHVTAFGMPRDVAQHYWERAWTDPLTGKLMGHVDVGHSAPCRAWIEYTCNYCLKKMTVEGDEWLQGRSREFVIRPNRPGLGLSYPIRVAEALMSDPHVYAMILAAGDVPQELILDGSHRRVDKVFLNQVRNIVLSEAGAELAREARKLNYQMESRAGLAEHGRAWVMGGPAVAEQAIRNRLGRAKIFAQGRYL